MVTYNIINDDCVKALQALPDKSVDVIFIDPPYNTGNTQDKTPTYTKNEDYIKKKWKSFHASWDTIDNYELWAIEWLRESNRVLKPKGSMFICGSFHNIPEVAYALGKTGFYTIQWIAWCIPNSFPNLAMTKMVSANQTIIWARPSSKVSHFYDKEAAKSYNDGKNIRDYWIIPNNTSAGKGTSWKQHPSKKPVSLVSRAIDIALPKKGEELETSLTYGPLHIVDFFAGSGTTGEACRALSVDTTCTLIEKDPMYIEWIKERMLV